MDASPSVAGPARLDVLIAVGSATLAAGALLVLPLLARADPSATEDVPEVGAFAWWATLTIVIAQSIVLVWRRRHIDAVTIAVAAAVPIGAACGMGSVLGLTSIAILVAVYTLALDRPPRRAWPLLTATFLAVAAGYLVTGLDSQTPVGQAIGAGVLQGAILIGAPVAVATLVSTRRESRSAREDQYRALDREREALVQSAIARERTAMARELHDIAAHHLTGIAIMSAAISAQIDTDPAAAKQSVGDLRHQSTAVLRDLRQLVGLLRDDAAGADPAVVRVESVAGIADLVRTVTLAGQDVGLTVLRAPGDEPLGWHIGPLAQLATYRMVQESLTNAGRHAVGARCEIEIDDRAATSLVVTVHNAAPTRAVDPNARPGLGLVGMQERAELTGSRLEHGPAADGGWRVRLTTPRDGSQDAS